MAASAVAVTLAFATLNAVVPATHGWAICTPLNGAMLAILLMSRRKLWPFLMFGYVLALSMGASLVGAAHQPGAIEIFGNIAELGIAAFTLPPFRNFKQWLQEPRLLRAFAKYALVIGPAMMALTVARMPAGAAGAVADLHAGFWERVRIVGFAEALGVALGTSLMLVLCNRKTYSLLRWRALPLTLGMYLLLGLATWLAFTQTAYPAIFLPYAILIVIAFVLGVRGAVIGTSFACAMICALTAPPAFALAQASGTGMTPQSYMALAVLAALPLGVIVNRQTELEQRVTDYQAELDKLKSLDRLTGVANRKRFDLVLKREWQRATRDPKTIALLMIDVDYFELYTEHYGMQAGDECLRMIATKMAEHPHRQYDLVSRFENGRFTVLLPGASGKSVKRIGEEFRAEIAALDWPHEHSQFGRVTVSVGWASLMPEGDMQPEMLIAAAEEALTAARTKGKNRVEGFRGSPVEMTATR